MAWGRPGGLLAVVVDEKLTLGKARKLLGSFDGYQQRPPALDFGASLYGQRAGNGEAGVRRRTGSAA